MKKLLVLLFSILISFNSYGKTVCVDPDSLEEGVIIYLPNETKPFTGKNLCKYENGQIMLEVNYKDGKKDALETWWYEHGQKQSEGNYKEGKVDGKFTAWCENGEIMIEVYYRDGKEASSSTRSCVFY
jgi:antitoxin component YwqK of YwqJK toxin-antitoxin module